VVFPAVLLTACDDEGAGKADAGDSKAPEKQPSSEEAAAKLNKRCEELGKACGDKEKHQDGITAECKEAAKTHVEKGCADKALAAYDCYEKELCEKVKKIWVLDDFRVLTERHEKCVNERKAESECIAPAEK
jgi:hypothetical protein